MIQTKVWLRLPDVGTSLPIIQASHDWIPRERAWWCWGSRVGGPGLTVIGAHVDDLGLTDPENVESDGEEGEYEWNLPDPRKFDAVSVVEVAWWEGGWRGVRYEVYAKPVIGRQRGWEELPPPRTEGDEVQILTCLDGSPGVWLNYNLVFCGGAARRIRYAASTAQG